MKQLMVVAAMVLVGASGAFAADQTWTGKISDSKCGATHAAGEHGKKMTDRACTEACVKGGVTVFASTSLPSPRVLPEHLRGIQRWHDRCGSMRVAARPRFES